MGKAETITIALTPALAEFVRGAVENGDYASTGEAVREAVREWKERRDLLGYTVEELRGLAREGLSSRMSARASMEDVKAEARFRHEARSAPDA
jgi:antitoxin ParD1/3/4